MNGAAIEITMQEMVVQWRIQDFLEEGAPTPKGGRQHTILPYFPENCMKLKEFRPPRGGARPSRPPLDPPMGTRNRPRNRNIWVNRRCQLTLTPWCDLLGNWFCVCSLSLQTKISLSGIIKIIISNNYSRNNTTAERKEAAFSAISTLLENFTPSGKFTFILLSTKVNFNNFKLNFRIDTEQSKLSMKKVKEVI